MDRINPGSINQSIIFSLSTAGLAITNMRLGYIRWTEGDGTSFTKVGSVPLIELASFNSAYLANRAKYLDTTANVGNKFLLRVDFPDGAFAGTKDRVICNVYDSINNIVAQRIFNLKVDISQYSDNLIHYEVSTGVAGQLLGFNGKVNKPSSNWADTKALAEQLGRNVSLVGALTIDTNTDRFNFYPRFNKIGSSVSFINGDAGISIERSHFERVGFQCTATTTLDASLTFKECDIYSPTGVTQLAGVYRSCIFQSTDYQLQFNTTLINCSRVATTTVINFIMNGSNSLLVHGFASRSITISSLSPGQVVRLVDCKCIVTIDASCTGGFLYINGDSKIVDNAGGAVLVDTIVMGLVNWAGNEVTGDGDWAQLQTDVSTIEGKLPTNEIMGSSTKSDKDTVIDTIQAKTTNLPADPASETNVNDNEAKLDTIISTGSTGPWTSGGGGGGDATEAKQDTIIAKQLVIETKVDTVDGKADTIISTGSTGPWTSGSGPVTLEDNASNKNIVQAGADQALDASNTAQAIPDTETGSIRDWIQFVATIVKSKKIEIDTLQSILKENGVDVYGTRTIATDPASVTLGEVS